MFVAVHHSMDAIAESKLVQDMGEVGLDGGVGDHEGPGDLGVSP